MILSFFDESGNMLRPWMENGFRCVAVDIKNKGNIENHKSGGFIKYVNIDLSVELSLIANAVFYFGKPKIIFGFPPCTDLAVSGACHFASKLKKDPFVFEKALYLAKVVPSLASVLQIPWMIENPVGKLSTLWRKPDFIFNPYEYGGYLPHNDVHPRYPDYIKPRDAYPKKTCLWFGNGFVVPKKQPVPVAPGYSEQHKKLGGKSEKTKTIRSETPRGFARAVFMHNVFNVTKKGSKND